MQIAIISVPTFSNKENITNGSFASALILKAFKEATFISSNVTNGDVLKAMFPKAECKREQDVVYFDINTKGEMWFSSLFDIAWWDAPYKAESEEDA